MDSHDSHEKGLASPMKGDQLKRIDSETSKSVKSPSSSTSKRESYFLDGADNFISSIWNKHRRNSRGSSQTSRSDRDSASERQSAESLTGSSHSTSPSAISSEGFDGADGQSNQNQGQPKQSMPVKSKKCRGNRFYLARGDIEHFSSPV